MLLLLLRVCGAWDPGSLAGMPGNPLAVSQPRGPSGKQPAGRPTSPHRSPRLPPLASAPCHAWAPGIPESHWGKEPLKQTRPTGFALMEKGLAWFREVAGVDPPRAASLKSPLRFHLHGNQRAQRLPSSPPDEGRPGPSGPPGTRRLWAQERSRPVPVAVACAPRADCSRAQGQVRGSPSSPPLGKLSLLSVLLAARMPGALITSRAGGWPPPPLCYVIVCVARPTRHVL